MFGDLAAEQRHKELKKAEGRAENEGLAQPQPFMAEADADRDRKGIHRERGRGRSERKIFSEHHYLSCLLSQRFR